MEAVLLHGDLDEVAEFPGPSHEYCPVSIGARLVGDKWTLLIVRELLTGSSRFNDIHRGVPTISRSLLASRLREMTRDGLILKLVGDSVDGGGYRLTPAGLALEPVITALGNWAVDWQLPQAHTVDEDPASVLWHIFRTVDSAALPDGGLTIEFRFPHSDPSRGWMAFDRRGRGSVCIGAPARPADLIVTTDPGVLYQLSYGYLSCAQARNAGKISFAGTPALEDGFRSFFSRSPFADRIASHTPLTG